MNNFTLPCLLVFLLGLVALDVLGDKDEIKKERAHYCEMVDLHRSSDGENGWPDYKKVYSEECSE